MLTTSALPFIRKRKLSLTFRVSALLVLAVVSSLLITVIGSELILRPTLISQATAEMQTDAQSHVQTIDSLFISHLQDLEFLDHFFAIQQFLSGNTIYRQQALNELTLGYRLDANYSDWTLFDLQGNVLLSSPAAPTTRGKYLIPPAIMSQLQGGGTQKTLISEAYFDSNTHMAFVDLYTTIFSTNGTFLGIGRSTLKLTDIWTSLNNETNATPGSYAMIVDGHNVCIGYTNTDATLTTLPAELFKAITPPSPQFQQRIQDENLYGNSHSPVAVVADPTLAQQQGDGTFQLVPALQTASFQAYQVHTHVVPWTYVVFRPLNTIIEAANRQDMYLILLATVITILAAVVGITVGSSITQPILRSVSSLSLSSDMLKTLATREKATASEQKWIVESSQNGLKSVQYYADASRVAAQRLGEVGQGLAHNLEKMDTKKVQHQLKGIINTADYIENAASHQERSSRSLSTAMRITTQVTEQLLTGATSASEAATQLEEVITQLRQVVGE